MFLSEGTIFHSVLRTCYAGAETSERVQQFCAGVFFTDRTCVHYIISDNCVVFLGFEYKQAVIFFFCFLHLQCSKRTIHSIVIADRLKLKYAPSCMYKVLLKFLSLAHKKSDLIILCVCFIIIGLARFWRSSAKISEPEDAHEQFNMWYRRNLQTKMTIVYMSYYHHYWYYYLYFVVVVIFKRCLFVFDSEQYTVDDNNLQELQLLLFVWFSGVAMKFI